MINLNDFNNFDTINEDMHVASKKKLRDAVHDIIIELEFNKEITTKELSEKLNDLYNIKISPEILNKLLFENWWRNNDYSIFKDTDKKWLDVWPFKKTIEKKKNKLKSPFGKGRRKIKDNELTNPYTRPNIYPPEQNNWRNWKNYF